MQWVRMLVRQEPMDRMPWTRMETLDLRAELLPDLMRELEVQAKLQLAESVREMFLRTAVLLEVLPSTNSLTCCPFPQVIWPGAYPMMINSPRGIPESGLAYHVKRPGPGNLVSLEPFQFGRTGPAS